MLVLILEKLRVKLDYNTEKLYENGLLCTNNACLTLNRNACCRIIKSSSNNISICSYCGIICLIHHHLLINFVVHPNIFNTCINIEAIMVGKKQQHNIIGYIRVRGGEWI